MEQTIKTAPAGQFTEALGIGPARKEQIDNITARHIEENDNFPAALRGMSHQLDDGLELAYAAFQLGAFAGGEHEKEKMMRILNG